MNKVTISTSNTKLGAYIPCVNLPPIKTCRAGAPCAKNCYACKGNYCYKNVKKSLEDNLNYFNSNSNDFKNHIINYLNNSDIIYKRFRWHSSGDIVNTNYLSIMAEIAEKTPHTQFLAFTKKFELVNKYIKNGGKIPKNLHIIFSAWDRDFKVKNPYNFPVAYVIFKDEHKTPKKAYDAFECRGKCANCRICWNLKNGESVAFLQH